MQMPAVLEATLEEEDLEKTVEEARSPLVANRPGGGVWKSGISFAARMSLFHHGWFCIILDRYYFAFISFL